MQTDIYYLPHRIQALIRSIFTVRDELVADEADMLLQLAEMSCF